MSWVSGRRRGVVVMMPFEVHWIRQSDLFISGIGLSTFTSLTWETRHSGFCFLQMLVLSCNSHFSFWALGGCIYSAIMTSSQDISSLLRHSRWRFRDVFERLHTVSLKRLVFLRWLELTWLETLEVSECTDTFSNEWWSAIPKYPDKSLSAVVNLGGRYLLSSSWSNLRKNFLKYFSKVESSNASSDVSLGSTFSKQLNDLKLKQVGYVVKNLIVAGFLIAGSKASVDRHAYYYYLNLNEYLHQSMEEQCRAPQPETQEFKKLTQSLKQAHFYWLPFAW